jgi:hypothetical protein
VSHLESSYVADISTRSFFIYIKGRSMKLAADSAVLVRLWNSGKSDASGCKFLSVRSTSVRSIAPKVSDLCQLTRLLQGVYRGTCHGFHFWGILKIYDRLFYSGSTKSTLTFYLVLKLTPADPSMYLLPPSRLITSSI